MRPQRHQRAGDAGVLADLLRSVSRTAAPHFLMGGFRRPDSGLSLRGTMTPHEELSLRARARAGDPDALSRAEQTA